jgi:hypothetical protein
VLFCFRELIARCRVEVNAAAPSAALSSRERFPAMSMTGLEKSGLMLIV